MPTKQADQPFSRLKTDDPPDDESLTAFSAAVRATAYLLWEAAGSPPDWQDGFWYKALDQHIRARIRAQTVRQNPSREK